MLDNRSRCELFICQFERAAHCYCYIVNEYIYADFQVFTAMHIFTMTYYQTIKINSFRNDLVTCGDTLVFDREFDKSFIKNTL